MLNVSPWFWLVHSLRFGVPCGFRIYIQWRCGMKYLNFPSDTRAAGLVDWPNRNSGDQMGPICGRLCEFEMGRKSSFADFFGVLLLGTLC